MKNTKTKSIWVNPIERISFQGRHKQVYEIRTENGLVPTVSKRKAKESGTTSEYSFPYNSHTGKLYTTLDKMITNPFYQLEVEEVKTKYPISGTWDKLLPTIVKQSEIKKQTYLEIKHGVDPDYYNSNVSYVITSLPQDLRTASKKPFLSTLKLILYPRPNEFNDSTPRQELLMCLVEALKDTNIIASNSQVANSSIHDWYVPKENEEQEKKAKRREVIEDATYKMVKLKREYGDYRTYQMGIILTDKQGASIMKGKPTKEAINNILSDFIADSNSNQMFNIETFNSNIRLLEDNQHDYFDVKYLLRQALNTRVIGHRDNKYIWYSKAGSADVHDLGSSFDKMLNFFYSEYEIYSPKSDTSNWYADLLEEVKSKNIWIE